MSIGPNAKEQGEKMSKYDVKQIRQKMKEKKGYAKDPLQFIPPNVKDDDSVKFRFYILPPLREGENVFGGDVASKSMELFYIQNGDHWIDRRPYPCPKLHDGDDCPMCNLGFDLMNETTDRNERSAIARKHLPQTKYAVNIYFPNSKSVPEEYRGKTMWYNAPKTVLDIWEECIYKDAEGDPEDPQAFGCFYDEEEAYLFQLEVVKNGEWNDYKKSKFLTNVGKNPVSKDTKAVLALRHDLYSKFSPRDVEAIKGKVNSFVNKEEDGFDEEEKSVVEETTTVKPTSSDIAGELEDDNAPEVEETEVMDDE